MQSRTFIIYHGGCPDGAAAAWWLGRQQQNVTYVPAAYVSTQEYPDVTDSDNVYVVDFCPPRPVVDRLAATAETFILLDHHETAFQILEGLPITTAEDMAAGMVEFPAYVLDREWSGAGLAGLWMMNPPDPILKYVQDRDLWRHELPFSAEVSAAISTYPTTPEGIAAAAAETIPALARAGKSVLALLAKMVDDTAARAWEVTIGGHRVWAVDAPYNIGSDVAGRLAERDPSRPFAAYRIVHADREQWGLRVRGDSGFDVSAVAAIYGGGGHKSAAGFSVPGGVLSVLDAGSGVGDGLPDDLVALVADIGDRVAVARRSFALNTGAPDAEIGFRVTATKDEIRVTCHNLEGGEL